MSCRKNTDWIQPPKALLTSKVSALQMKGIPKKVVLFSLSSVAMIVRSGPGHLCVTPVLQLATSKT